MGQTVKNLLISYASQLRQEYDQLKIAGKLERESECIHDSGNWSRFEATAVWQKLSRSGCAEGDAPVSCSLFSKLRDSLDFPVIRLGFSALAASTHLKSHHGMTNGQLKLHLGLTVPGDCATFRVHNETRSWTQDEVLFFDDSFEHEVHNSCESERVVFQVVFRHFDL